MNKDLETDRFQTRQDEERPEESPGRDTNWARGSPQSPVGQRLDRSTPNRTENQQQQTASFPEGTGGAGIGKSGAHAPVPRQASVDLRSNLATGRHGGSDRTGRPARGQEKAAGLGFWSAGRRPGEDERTGILAGDRGSATRAPTSSARPLACPNQRA